MISEFKKTITKKIAVSQVEKFSDDIIFKKLAHDLIESLDVNSLRSLFSISEKRITDETHEGVIGDYIEFSATIHGNNPFFKR